MSGLRAAIEAEWITGLVQRRIFCPVTENVLDSRTCAVLRDKEGTISGVYDPEVLNGIEKDMAAELKALGYTLHPNPALDTKKEKA